MNWELLESLSPETQLAALKVYAKDLEEKLWPTVEIDPWEESRKRAKAMRLGGWPPELFEPKANGQPQMAGTERQ